MPSVWNDQEREPYYATRKHPKVSAWLDKHPRFNMHFTPTSSSWLNLVECFFADLTGDVIRAGSFADLRTGAQHQSLPYKWKAEAALDKAEAA